MIVCATQTRGKIALRSSDVGSARYVSSISSTLPTQRELDERILTGADRVIIDTPDALEESGDVIEACQRGLELARVEHLSNFLAAPSADRQGVTVYKSIGSI